MITGFTCSTFDLLHPGHIKHLEFAKDNSDYLIVGFQTGIPDRPEKNKPIQTVYERWIQLNALGLADEIIPYESESDLLNLIKNLPEPYTRFIGEEYKGQDFTGKSLIVDVPSWDTKENSIVYTPRNHTWSTTELRNRIINSKYMRDWNDMIKPAQYANTVSNSDNGQSDKSHWFKVPINGSVMVTDASIDEIYSKLNLPERIKRTKNVNLVDGEIFDSYRCNHDEDENISAGKHKTKEESKPLNPTLTEMTRSAIVDTPEYPVTPLTDEQVEFYLNASLKNLNGLKRTLNWSWPV